MLTRDAGVTDSVAEPEIEAELAVMVVVPTPTLCANPFPLIVAAAGVEEVQEAEVVSVRVLPSV